jgi:hypothetical protein
MLETRYIFVVIRAFLPFDLGCNPGKAYNGLVDDLCRQPAGYGREND